MIKQIITTCHLLAATIIPLQATAQITVEECHELARQNYPLLKKYDLIGSTTSYTIKNINKGYLPQIAVNGQASYQSDVATLPSALSDMLENNGYNVKGLEKDQYKIGVDINQLIWDGGNLSAQKEVAKKEEAVQTAQTDIDMYALKERVNNLFFGILLIDERIKQNKDLQTLLSDNCRKLEAMLDNGTAMKADVDVMKAEYLGACQQYTELASMKRSYQQMLAIFIGKDMQSVSSLAKPKVAMPADTDNYRPELMYYSALISKTDAQRELLNASLLPKISIFAQGYYGYPGYDMFNDMFDHDWTLNGIIGIRVSWNISSFYTDKNERRKLDLAKEQTETARETFLFNNRLEYTKEAEAVEKYKSMIKEDAEIISLRTSVRQAAEAKLDNGIIDINNLLQEINRENNAQISGSTHEIEMLKSIYDMKNTLNQ
ncbi:MAG: TolC family protein [Prevotellaceae bacterium]|nr:TolC family protein [Prevotellaceae bacterium]